MHKRLYLLYLWAAALTLGGSLPAQAQQPAATPAATPVGPPGSGSIWRALGDSTLERLIGDALRGNHDVRIATARVRGARAARFGAALDLAPAVTVGGGFTRQRLATSMSPGASGSLPDQNLWDAGLGVSWEVDVFGRGRRTLRGQGELASASAEDLRTVHVLLAAEVADAYFAMRGAQDRLAVAEGNAENQRRTLELTRQRLEGGRGTALDSERAQAQLSATLADMPALEATIAATRHRLSVLTVRSAAALEPELGNSAPPVTLLEEPSLASADPLIRQRPDVRSAERQAAASAAFVGAAKADYLPRLAIGGGAGYTSTTVESLGNTGTPRYSIASVVSWPALDIGRVRARVDAARAGELEARSRYEQTALQARAEVETSLITYRRARERLRHLDESAGASERAAELARLRFTEGASDFLPVLDAERTLLEAQDRQALGRVDATTALVAVYRALGGAWPPSAGGAR